MWKILPIAFAVAVALVAGQLVTDSMNSVFEDIERSQRG